MTAKEALIEYMKANGYTSLVNPWLPCGCFIDDIAPCETIDIDDCALGYTKDCDSDCKECLVDKRKDLRCATLEKP